MVGDIMEDAIFCFIAAAFMVAAGIFCIVCSVKNLDWFFNNSKARPLVKIFGRNGTRIFYICLGVFIVVMGLMGAAGGFLMLGE